MAVFKCKMCGGNLDVERGITVCECMYCGTKQTVPEADDDKKMLLFSRANRLRLDCEFDKAFGIYEAIVSDFPEEAEAYWGLLLCKYGIEYVDDPATAKKVPTCHRSSFDSVMDDENFELVMENSRDSSRSLYREEAKRIEELRKGIIETSCQADPYDIFICYKETNQNGERTLDSVIAQDVYEELVDRGYRVFFSRVTLEDKLGQEYEPYIFSALNSAKIMLVFGTDYEHYNAVWVKNEWSRFLQLIAKGEKKVLIPCYKGIDAYDMPKEFSRLQSQDMGKVGAVQDLLRGVEKILQAQENQTFKQSDSNNLLIDEAFSLLEDGNFKMAEKHCDNILQKNPKEAKAYLVKLMAQLKIRKFTAASFLNKRYLKNDNYFKVMEYGDDYLKEKLNGFVSYKKKFIAKRIAFLASIMVALLVAVDLSRFFEIRDQYTDCVTKFESGAEDYQFLEDKFSKMWGFADSEYYAMLCGANNGRVYEDVTELTYHTSLEGCVLNDAFPNLKKVIIPDGVTKLESYSFSSCQSLETVKMADSVVIISEHAFSGCSALKNVELSSRVTNIEAMAFADCSSLESIELPDSVTIMGYSVFLNCDSLKTIYCESSNVYLDSWIIGRADVEVVRVENQDTRTVD